MLEKSFARTLLGNLACVRKDRLEMPILLHQLGGCLVTNATDTRYVVRRVTY